MQKYRTFLTKLGKEKIIAAEAASTHLAFKHIAVGDAADPPTEDLTKLRNEVWRGEIQRIQVDALDNHVLNVEAVIPSQDGGFMVRELGLFDTDGDLIAVGRAPDSYKPLVEDGAAKSLLIVFKIVIDNTSVVVLNVDDSVVLVTRKYLEHQLSLHTDRKDNPHGVTKAQVGLNNVANYAVATETEAKDGTSNTKYMTPLRTNQLVGQIAGETAAGVQTNLNEHIAETENPHKVTKAQVGLSNVDNVKQATKTEFDIHTADKTNPHGVTKSQVGLASVLNYGVATQTEAEAGTSNAKYMTPLSTKQAITKQAATLVTTHVDDKTNPHNVTKAQVGLGKVQDYELATEADAESGITHQKYMTPLRTKQAITKQLDIHANDYVAHPGYANTTGTNAYSVTLNPKPTALVAGLGVVIKVGNNATANCTLNVNGLGAKPIVDSGGKQVKNLRAGGIYSLRYGGTSFILQGEGGGGGARDYVHLLFQYKNGVDKIVIAEDVAVVTVGELSVGGKRVVNLSGTVIKEHPPIDGMTAWAVTEAQIIQYMYNYSREGYIPRFVVTDYMGNELYRTSLSRRTSDHTIRVLGYDVDNNNLYVIQSHYYYPEDSYIEVINGNGSKVKEQSINYSRYYQGAHKHLRVDNTFYCTSLNLMYYGPNDNVTGSNYDVTMSYNVDTSSFNILTNGYDQIDPYRRVKMGNVDIPYII